MGINNKIVSGAILGLVLIVILFQVYAAVVPTAQEQGDAIGDESICEGASCFYNSSRTIACTANNETGDDTDVCADSAAANGIPLSGLFSGSGVVFIVVMAMLLVMVVGSLLKRK